MAKNAFFDIADYPNLGCESWLSADATAADELLDHILDPALTSCFPQQAANVIGFDSFSPELLSLDMALDKFDALTVVPDLVSPIASDAVSPASTWLPGSPASTTTPLSSSSSSSSSSDAESVSSPPKRRRTTRPRARGPRLSHNAVEKNYRDSVNTALQRLQQAVPRVAASTTGDADADADALGFAVRPPTKAAILHAAVDYIQQLVQERDNALQETDALRAAVRQGEFLLDKAALKDAVADIFSESRRCGRSRMV